MTCKAGKIPVIVIITIAMVTFLSGPIFADVFVAPSVNYGTGVYPFEVACGDFNNDGKLDVATANMRSVSLLLGNGDGTFQAKSDIMLALWDASHAQSFWNITTGDFDNDGKLDIIVKGADWYLGGTLISVLLGNGDGTFHAPKNYSFGESTASTIAAGDFNGDGKLDIVMDNFGSVSVLLGNGDGSFQAKKDYAVGGPYNQIWKVKTVDVNVDGKLDIITGDWSNAGNSGTISVLLGRGDGTFSAGTVLDLSGFIRDIVTGDFNGDGSIDIAAIKYEYNTQYGYVHNAVSVFIQNGDGTFQTRKDYVTGLNDTGGGAIAAADINGDGKLDLVTASYMSVSILISNGDGTFQPKNNTSWVTADNNSFFALAAADFNKDGKLDLVATADRNHAVSIFINATPNRIPVANAGNDQVIECAGPSGASVALDGSASYDPDGDVLTYKWSWAGGATEGVRPLVELPLGTTLITLTVSDGKTSSTAKVSITIQDTNSPITIATGGNGEWYSASVLTTFSSSDTCAGVKDVHFSVDGFETVVPGGFVSTLISTEGEHNVLYRSTDNAGNVENVNNLTVKIDNALPLITATVTPSPINGWNNSEVTVSFQCYDALSGIAQCSVPVSVNTEGGGQVITGTVIDKAGNKATLNVPINNDKTSPAITGSALTPPNANGWYNENVTVHFSATDALSGIASLTPDTVVSTEGAGQAVTGTAVDMAGNQSAYSVTEINVDKTPPVITITGVTNGATYNLGLVPTASFIAVDGLSGVATSSGSLTGGDAQGLELFTYTVTATDKAGNTAITSVSYTVIATPSGTALLIGTLPLDSQSAANLSSTLATAMEFYANGNSTAGDEKMGAFINQVNAPGQNISSDIVAMLINAANYIIAHN